MGDLRSRIPGWPNSRRGRMKDLPARMAPVADADGDLQQIAPIGVEMLDPLAGGALSTSSPRMYADVAILTRILLAADRRVDAVSVVANLEQFAARHPDFPFLDCAVLHARAVLDSDADTALLAVARSNGDPCSLVVASVLEDAGRLLPESRTPEAVPLLESSLELYAAAGAQRDASRVHSLLRIRGVRPAARGLRSAPQWPELTESGFAVVSLSLEEQRTVRSPSASSCRRRRSTPTCGTCSASWGSARASSWRASRPNAASPPDSLEREPVLRGPGQFRPAVANNGSLVMATKPGEDCGKQ